MAVAEQLKEVEQARAVLDAEMRRVQAEQETRVAQLTARYGVWWVVGWWLRGRVE